MKLKLLLSTLLICSLNAQDLKTTINEVLSTNPIILERLKNYNSTKEDITSAKSGYYPKLELSLGGGIEKNEKKDVNAITTLRDKNNNPVDSLSLSVYQNSLTYTQNLFKGFETSYQVKAQEQRTLSAAYSIMVPFFKTSKTSFLILPLYDTSGNSFAPLGSKLLTAL
ncbi:TolC family protein [Sulfurimonas sp.]|uniref:TolC family protein n=1 Tax=Sulfurimonas sp. TaxID=2022749 RepID=UPI002AAFA5CD|nr:TolC family protein [Sulfurimonas sp.]